ncbi:MAG TPA: hypothetical protein VF032_16620 [Thermoleophilaceae bacterium]
MRTRIGLICGCAAAAIAGCGGGGGAHTATHAIHRQSVCLPAARDVVGRATGSPVTQKESTGNNAQPQCTFRAGRTAVIANVDSSPQPFQRLERTVVEYAQQFSSVREEPPPQRVARLGLDADWFPRERQLLTADNRRLITVTVTWPGASRAKTKALAVGVARVYLGR